MSDTHPLRITWVGHATVLIEIGGIRVITDPALTPSLAHLRRRRPAPVGDAVEADVVGISHLHMDHLHRPSLRLIAGASRALVPSGAARLLRDLGFTDIHEMQPGEHHEITLRGQQLRIEAVHADHSGSRGPHSRVAASAMGYVFRSGGRAVYFAGDTDLFAGMADIGPVDVALLPVWGWGPSLGERHLNPDSAADATLLLQARHVIPIHWGTYSPRRVRRGSPPWLDDPLAAFRTAIDRTAPEQHLIELWPGESAIIDA